VPVSRGALQGIARVPGTDAPWAVGSIGAGDDEAGFVLRR
jgi:hypothetical protein